LGSTRFDGPHLNGAPALEFFLFDEARNFPMDLGEDCGWEQAEGGKSNVLGGKDARIPRLKMAIFFESSGG
jgi:hypothetical protein